MTPEEKRIAIAEACLGLTHMGPVTGKLYITLNGRDVLFDPLNDLNAMHEAIMLRMTDKEAFFRNLYRVASGGAGPHWFSDLFAIINSTAAQRADAFLLTLGKEI